MIPTIYSTQRSVKTINCSNWVDEPVWITFICGASTFEVYWQELKLTRHMLLNGLPNTI
ncbi:MAG: hypothetical protein KF866_07250 [Phycisphaeraceae bacterium]|nr:hypothetical protein [Phycisphaeraceae bacterium]